MQTLPAPDVVGVALDMDHQTIRYYLNGVDLGVAFQGFGAGEGEPHVNASSAYLAGADPRFPEDAEDEEGRPPGFLLDEEDGTVPSRRGMALGACCVGHLDGGAIPSPFAFYLPQG